MAETRILTASMDNLDAWRLGKIAREAAAQRAGDQIDTGLILLKLLNERGYTVTVQINPRDEMSASVITS